MPVALWADLPVPSSIRVRTATGRTAWLTASRRRLQVASAEGEAAFGPVEYEAALGGLLEGRMGPPDFDRWIDRKRAVAGWALTPLEAVGGAVGLLDGRGQLRTAAVLGRTTFAQALALLGCIADTVLVEAAPQAAAQEPEVVFVGL